MAKHQITAVQRGSIADELGLAPGDWLLRLDGQEVADVLDYRFRLQTDVLEASFETAGGELFDAEIDKDEEDDLGLSFEGLMARKRSCANDCIFCFVNQLPPQVRESLRFKDDDWRLSFLSGNYVTLTNLPDKELERIIAQRISPLYISVHALDPDVRAAMLRQPKGSRLPGQLQRLCEGGIEFHSQIVLCPGVNDGDVLMQTLTGLYAMKPYALDCAVVPVGLTAHRKSLPVLKAFDAQSASAVIDQVERLAGWFRQMDGEPFAYCADELYVLAGRETPDTDYYGAFGQLEDGVGMLCYFEHGFTQALYGARPRSPLRATVATGGATHAFMQRMAQQAADRLNVEVDVIYVPNRFFGGHVDVAGLLTGADYYNTLSQYDLGDVLLISRASLRSEGDMFLDDMLLAELQQRLAIDIVPVESDGASFVDVLSTWRI